MVWRSPASAFPSRHSPPTSFTRRAPYPRTSRGSFASPSAFSNPRPDSFSCSIGAHTRYTAWTRRRRARGRSCKIGAEAGRIIDPTAFSVARDGSFVVADAPNGRERIQLFSADGVRTGGFLLPGRMRPRVTIDSQVLNGIGSLQYTGTSILMSQPETGALVAEFNLSGGITRTFGQLRPTGHEDDRELHLALNSGLALVDPSGGFFFVFQTGEPTFRKYDANGHLVFERRVEGREIDPVRAALPTTWGTRHTSEGDIPFVSPTVRTAAVDAAGRLWISFVVPFTYVYDGDGDKLRTLQFRGAGIVSPASLFFGPKGQLLVTPGLLEFQSER